MGAHAHSEISRYIDQIQGTHAIEIGAAKVEETVSSTKWYIDFFEQHQQLAFTTFDLDPDIQVNVQVYMDNNNITNSSFVLEPYDQSNLNDIAFAYLDNFDYPPPGCEWHEWLDFHKQKYRDWGTELTLENSADAHLEQVKWLQSRMSQRAIIIFDDTFRVEETFTHAEGFRRGESEKGYVYPSEGWYGKGMAAVPWLLENGWHLLDKPERDRDDWTILANFETT